MEPSWQLQTSIEEGIVGRIGNPIPISGLSPLMTQSHRPPITEKTTPEKTPPSLQSEGKDYPPISCLINGHNSIIAVTQPMKTTRIPIYLTPPIKFVQFLFFRQKASCTLFAYLPSLKKQKTQNKRPLSLSLSLSLTHTHTHIDTLTE